LRTKTVPQWRDTQPDDPMAALFDEIDRHACEPGHGKCDQGRQCMARDNRNAARDILLTAIITLSTCSAGMALYIVGQMRGLW
jgi:hypothetical protein